MEQATRVSGKTVCELLNEQTSWENWKVNNNLSVR